MIDLKPLPEGLVLGQGNHSSPEAGMCLLEAAAWVAGEPFTDHPACVSPVLGAFGRVLNDALPKDQRQRLVPLVSLLPGTVDQVADQRDGLACAHYFVSVWTPRWFDLVPSLADHAAALRGVIVPGSWDDVAGWQPALDAAWDAAGDAAGAAALDAARDALTPTSVALRDLTTQFYEDMVRARAEVAR